MNGGSAYGLVRRSVLVLLLLASVVGTAQAGTGPESRPVAAPAVRSSTARAPAPTVRLSSGVVVDGVPRTFLLHVPRGLLAPAPLVVALHAYAQDAAKMRRYTRLEALADRSGFVVAFADGTSGAWAAGGCCGRARRDDVDDVSYLDGVIRAARAATPVDPARIALTGFSNGAMMALRYACERSRLVASVAVVAGTLVAPCSPSAPVAVLDLHGADDVTVPLGGGTNRRLMAVLPPVQGALRPFAAAHGRVEVRAVPGQGHGWLPGASAAVWDWVRDHPQTR